jgi:hypothetical protein
MPSDVRLRREKAVVRGASGVISPADQKIAQMMFRSLKTFFSTLVEHER